jgi:hypothetical protein
MTEPAWLADQFEHWRPHLASVAYGMLGSVSEAEDAVLAVNPDAFFTIPHFDGYSAVLIQLPKVTEKALKDAITDGWLACAPPALAQKAGPFGGKDHLCRTDRDATPRPQPAARRRSVPSGRGTPGPAGARPPLPPPSRAAAHGFA